MKINIQSVLGSADHGDESHEKSIRFINHSCCVLTNDSTTITDWLCDHYKSFHSIFNSLNPYVVFRCFPDGFSHLWPMHVTISSHNLK
jgi:hypothetical protein